MWCALKCDLASQLLMIPMCCFMEHKFRGHMVSGLLARGILHLGGVASNLLHREQWGNTLQSGLKWKKIHVVATGMVCYSSTYAHL